MVSSRSCLNNVTAAVHLWVASGRWRRAQLSFQSLQPICRRQRVSRPEIHKGYNAWTQGREAKWPSGWIGLEQVSIDCKTENLADEAVDPIASGVLASADNGLNELDDVGASDGPEIALGPFRQNVNGEIPPVLLG